MPFQTLLYYIVAFGRACPSMLCHIILGFGRAWKDINTYIKGFFGQNQGKGRKGTVHELEFATSGRACPSMLAISFWGFEKGMKGHQYIYKTGIFEGRACPSQQEGHALPNKK